MFESNKLKKYSVFGQQSLQENKIDWRICTIQWITWIRKPFFLQLTNNVVSENDVAAYSENAHKDARYADAGPDYHVVIPLCSLLQRVHNEEAIVMTHIRWEKGLVLLLNENRIVVKCLNV